jgi:hypothetical protein
MSRSLYLIGGLLLLAAPIRAQGSRGDPAERGMVAIGVALASSLPQEHRGTGTLILRRRTATPHDVLILEDGIANGDRLGEAMAALHQVHMQQGVCPPRDALLRVRTEPGARPPRWSEDAERGAPAILEKTRRAATVTLSQVGEVRLKEIWVKRLFNAKDPPPGIGEPIRPVCAWDRQGRQSP